MPARLGGVPEPQRPEQPYRLRIASITYLRDDAAAARGIEEFLRLRRARDRTVEPQVEEPGEVDDSGETDGRVPI